MPFSGTISAPESKRFQFRPPQAPSGNFKFRSCRKALTRFTTSPSLLTGDLWLLRPRRDHSRVEGFGYDAGREKVAGRRPWGPKTGHPSKRVIAGGCLTG